MNLIIPRTQRATRELRFCLLFAACLAQSCLYATDSIWINTGTISSPPQIDAYNFVNSGTITVGTTLPFETSNTRNYTNSGTMISTPGWFFDDAASQAGLRAASDSFVNLNDGSVIANDPGTIFVFGGAGIGNTVLSLPSYLFITASNIVNKGTLSVG